MIFFHFEAKYFAEHSIQSERVKNILENTKLLMRWSGP